jgi:hypothetical protein
VIHLDAAKGSRSPVMTLIGNGHARMDLTVHTAAPHTCALCADGQVGDLRVAGPSLVSGFWHWPEGPSELIAVRTRRIALGG